MDIANRIYEILDERGLSQRDFAKMMGKTDYVLGLEPGNCTPDGRDVLRKNGTLLFLQPHQAKTTAVTFTFVDQKNKFEGAF